MVQRIIKRIFPISLLFILMIIGFTDKVESYFVSSKYFELYVWTQVIITIAFIFSSFGVLISNIWRKKAD